MASAPTDYDALLKSMGDRLDALEQTAILPVGLVAFCAGPVPNGWLAIDGSTFSAARYGQLSAYLGGATTLPNASGRVIVSKAASGTFTALLSTGGAETVTLSLAQIPSHAHRAPGQLLGTLYSAAGSPLQGWNAPTIDGSSTTGEAVGGGGSHPNLQPYIVLQAIIKF